MALSDFGQRLLGALQDAGQFIQRGAENFASHFSQNIAQPIEQHVTHPIAQYLSDQGQYIQNNGLQNAANQVEPIVNSFAGKYVQNRIVDPVAQGIGSFIDNPSLKTAALGGLGVAGAAFNATPIGIGSNLAISGATSLAELARTGKTNLSENFSQGKQLSEGLGIQNPYVALPLDFAIGALATNPEGAFTGISKTGIKLGLLDDDLKSIASNPLLSDSAKMEQTRQAIQENSTLQQQKQNFAKNMADIPKSPVEASPIETAQFIRQSQPQAAHDLAVASQFDPELQAELGNKKSAWNSIFAPIKNLPEYLQKVYKDWAGKQLAAHEYGISQGLPIKQLRNELGVTDGYQFIKDVQSGNATGPLADQLRAAYDNLRQEAINNGYDVGYIDNYINQVWKESLSDILAKARGLSETPGFVKERRIPSYAEGEAIGLTPRFTTPEELVSHYAETLQKVQANVQFLDQLQQGGYVLPRSEAPRDWKSLEGPFFPRASHGEPYAAPGQLGEVINSVFKAQDDSAISRVLGKSAKFAQAWQDAQLAGGIPGTPANFFSFGQLWKETVSGRGIPAIQSAFRSFSEPLTQAFRADNQKLVTDLAKEGVTFGFKNPLNAEPASLWNKAMNAPTFERLMPNMQLQLGKDIVENLTGKGVPYEEAVGQAANTLKHFYRMENKLMNARPQEVEDALSSVFFAPKYRSGLIGTIVDTIKSINPATFADRSLDMNRRFLVGLGVAFFGYNELNKTLNNGQSMTDNGPGHTTDLRIPLANGQVLYVPFGPSILSVPRNIINGASAVVSGDSQEAGKDFASVFSSPIQGLTQLALNRNYYGDPIRDQGDSATQQALSLGGYGLSQLNPWVGAVYNYFAGSKNQRGDLAKALVQGSEFPVKIGSTSQEQSGKFFNAIGDVSKTLSDRDKYFLQALTSPTADSQNSGFNKQQQAILLLNNPQLFAAMAQVQKASGQLYDPVYDLPPDQAHQVLAQRADLGLSYQQQNALKQSVAGIPDFQNNLQAYYASIPQSGSTPALSPNLQNLLNQMGQLQGSQKQLFISNNPELQQYFNQNDAAKASAIGLSPTGYQAGSSSGTLSLTKPIGTGSSKIGSGLKRSGTHRGKGRTFKPKVSRPKASAVHLRVAKTKAKKVKFPKLKRI